MYKANIIPSATSSEKIKSLIGEPSPQTSNFFFELRIFFFYSQAYHAALIFAVLWLMIKYDMRMRYGSILKVVISTNIIVGLLSILNYALDSNYMFLRQIPNSVSPFLMGEWPVYIIMVQVFSIILVVLFIRIQDLLMKPIKY